jgi:membrane protease YdiL (CAAX protease family)
MAVSPMDLLTLTPEVHAYAVAAIVLYSLSCGELANYLRLRCAVLKQVAFLPVYVATMAVVVGFSVLILDLPSVVRCSGVVLALSLPLGFVAGAIAWWSELAIKRHLLRRNLLKPRQRRLRGSFFRMGPRTGWPERAWLADVVLNPDYLAANRNTARPYSMLGLLLLVGCFEEVLFRGVLVELILDIPSLILVVLGLAASVVLFASSHLRVGYGEVLAKLPLGALTLLVTLVTRSVVPAIVAHAYFNFRAWQTVALEKSGEVSKW